MKPPDPSKSAASFAGKFGRQEFEDAQFLHHTKEKLKILTKVAQQESDYDFIFLGLICLNLIVIGIETDLGPASPNGRKYAHPSQNPFFWIELFFLVCFTAELVLRYTSWRKRRTLKRQVECF